jgi:hypothetical protein
MYLKTFLLRGYSNQYILMVVVSILNSINMCDPSFFIENEW